ncbi:tetratricopeptide repeat protein [Paenibacillus campi]|uniref:tetratricopeptide repeat protein n=1 Tax=Paenibacillus campi TaxID=3106031 RepID=UPI002AFE0A41|nr:tetratricopeptide repeat protein [Paenibacillus sp. SGZ-1014]
MSDYTNETNRSAIRSQRMERLLEWERYEEALRETGEWLREAPETPAPYNALATIYMNMEKYEQALDSTAQALRIEPDNEDAWVLRAFVYYDQRNWTLMQQAVEEGLRINPYRAHLYYLLSNMYNMQGKFQQAQEQIKEALRFVPRSGVYLALYSYVLANLGNKQASQDVALEALQADLEHAQTFMYLGWAAQQRGDAKTAKQMMEQAIRLEPNNEQIRTEYIEALQKGYWFYRIFTLPLFLRKLKGWQLLLIWMGAWILFRPLLIVLIVLYIISHLLSKTFVHLQVYGWHRAPKSRKKKVKKG